MVNLLFPLSVIFILSLGGSFVLFKFLKSSATVKKPTFQAGGALAGFIIIYGLLFTTFNSWYQCRPDEWSIKGVVNLEGASIHDGISVKYIPPSPTTYSERSGNFRLENVKIFPEEGLPEIQFFIESDNYLPQLIEMNKMKQGELEIDKQKKY